MAILIPILAGIGGSAAAAALGASTAVSVAAGVATGAATASLMNKGGGGAPAAAAPDAPPPPAPPPTPPAPPPPPPSVDVSPGGAIRNVEAIRGERQGDTRVPGTGAGRQSTILTSARGIEGTESTRRRRTLGGDQSAATGMAAQGLLANRGGMNQGLLA